MNDPIASIGLRKDCELDKTDLEVGLRVTVKIISESKKVIKGKVVTPSTPREDLGKDLWLQMDGIAGQYH